MFEIFSVGLGKVSLVRRSTTFRSERDELLVFYIFTKLISIFHSAVVRRFRLGVSRRKSLSRVLRDRTIVFVLS